MKLPGSESSLNFIERFEKRRQEQAEKLASGLKINKAADDPAGLQIANRLTSAINEVDRRASNARDQQSIYNTQAGQLSSITDSLQRANELAIQAGNPLNDNSAIQAELDQLTDEINIIAESALGQTNFISGLDASDPSASQTIISDASAVIEQSAADIGASSNGLDSRINNYQISSINTSAARSRIQDTDFSESSSEQVKADIQLKIAVLTKKDEEERKGLLFNQFI
ncbi:flagellin [uncultured Shewanella sp.]|uniref:flagellin n=1 Tax=Shewanella atlantica TaxID=271099 RepID=UPI002612BC8B|nr:flagellin [uncultured Shewanella sp.]